MTQNKLPEVGKRYIYSHFGQGHEEVIITELEFGSGYNSGLVYIQAKTIGGKRRDYRLEKHQALHRFEELPEDKPAQEPSKLEVAKEELREEIAGNKNGDINLTLVMYKAQNLLNALDEAEMSKTSAENDAKTRFADVRERMAKGEVFLPVEPSWIGVDPATEEKPKSFWKKGKDCPEYHCEVLIKLTDGEVRQAKFLRSWPYAQDKHIYKLDHSDKGFEINDPAIEGYFKLTDFIDRLEKRDQEFEQMKQEIKRLKEDMMEICK